MGRGTAVVITAKELLGHDASGAESYWWQDLAEHRWGKSKWALELEVRPDGGTPYQVRDVFKMPNRLHKVRHVLKGPSKLRPGVELPVQIDDGDPSRLEIDWKAFVDGGGTEQLYADEPSVRDTVRGFVSELRSAGPSGGPPQGPRPTAATHPPVEGVDYELFMQATLGFVRSGRPREEWNAYCEENGYPPGRAEAINAEWYARMAGDDELAAWYRQDSTGSG